MNNQELIAQAKRNVAALKAAIQCKHFDICKGELETDLKLAEIALSALTVWHDASKEMPPNGQTVIVKNASGLQWVADVDHDQFYPDEFPVDKMSPGDVVEWMYFPDDALKAPAPVPVPAVFVLKGGSLREDGKFWYKAETVAEIIRAGGGEVVE